jgi:hypothetical protein
MPINSAKAPSFGQSFSHRVFPLHLRNWAVTPIRLWEVILSFEAVAVAPVYVWWVVEICV